MHAYWRHQVFVYGTLRQGGRYHAYLREAPCLGSCWLGPGMTLLDVGAYPGLVFAGNGWVLGEVYRVTPAMLRRLDRLEDHPRSYRRCRIETPWGAAWMYLYKPGARGHGRIPGGDWFDRVRRPAVRPWGCRRGRRGRRRDG